jgi:hypothetical protein
MGGVEMHSYYMLEKLAADRQQETFRNAQRHDLAAERWQPRTSKRRDWWAARRSGRLPGRSTVVALATVATS